MRPDDSGKQTTDRLAAAEENTGECDTIRALPSPEIDRPGRHGRGLPRLRHQDRPRRRTQGASASHGDRRDVPAAVPPGVAVRRRSQRSARRPDSWLRRDRRSAVSGHAADRGPQPGHDAAGDGKAARCSVRGHDHRTGRARVGRRASDRPDPPRYQAVEHPDHRPRLRLPHRLRPRPHGRGAGPDDGGQHTGHAGLHGARAIRGRRGRSPLRHLRADLRALRMPHRLPALPRRQLGAADRRAHDLATAAAFGHRSAAGRLRRRDRQGDGQEAREALSVRR